MCLWNWPLTKAKNIILSDVTSDSNTFSHENQRNERKEGNLNAKTEWKPFYTLNQTIEKHLFLHTLLETFIGLLGLLYYYSFFIWNQI